MTDKFVMLVAEDDQSDLELLNHALSRDIVEVDLQVTRDGDELVSYLQGEGRFRDRQKHPIPDLILLDLKMPRLGGLDVLHWLQEHLRCARIPTIVLSGSNLDADVEGAYGLGANTYFSKPNSLRELRELLRLVLAYWAHSERPPKDGSC